MPKQVFIPDQLVDMGVGKDNVNDFARKYNHQVEHIFDILNKNIVGNAVGHLTLADMKRNSTLKEEQIAYTTGYYEANDGGGGTYLIRAKTATDVVDGGSIHELQNGLVAELVIKDGKINVLQFGCHNDFETDDSPNIQNAINFGVKIKSVHIYFPSFARYVIKTPLKLKHYPAKHYAFSGDLMTVNRFGYNGGCNIFCLCNMFEAESGDRTIITATVENLAVLFVASLEEAGQSSESNPNYTDVNFAVFYKLGLHSSYVQNCYFRNCGYFIHNGYLHVVSNINNNQFMDITKAFICTYEDGDTNPNQADAYCSDCNISDNYINSKKKRNTVFMKGIFDVDSIIKHNYIDYFTYLAWYPTNTSGGMLSCGTYIENRFEPIFRVAQQPITGIFKGNYFSGNREEINKNLDVDSDELVKNGKVGAFIIDWINDQQYGATRTLDLCGVKLIDNICSQEVEYFLYVSGKPFDNAQRWLRQGVYEKGTTINGMKAIYQGTTLLRTVAELFTFTPFLYGTYVFTNNYIDTLNYLTSDEAPTTIAANREIDGETFWSTDCFEGQKKWFNGKLYIAHRGTDSYQWLPLTE